MSGHRSDPAAVRRRRHRVPEPVDERPRREPRDRALAGEPAHGRREPARRREPRDGVDEPRAPRDPPRAPQPVRQPPEQVVAPRPEPAAVVLVEELRLVRRHVDAGRAVRPAAAAGEAQVERLAHVGRAPAVVRERARHELLEQARPAARRVALVAGRAVRGAQQRMVLARDAPPEADAPLDALAQVAAVRREREARRRGRAGRGPRPAEVRGRRQRPDDDARVEHVARVPDRLPLAERGDECRAELAGEELAPGAAVAVLAAERAAVRDREVRGGRHEPLEAVLAARPVEAEPRPQVEAALAEVAVDRPLERMLAEQPAELAEVAGEPVPGTAGSSNPGQAGVPSGSRAARPAPSSRTRHRAARSRGSSRTSEAADPGVARSPPRAARRGRGPRPASRRRPRRAARRRPAAAARRRRGPRAARGQALDGERAGGEQRRDGGRRLDVVREPEHEQDASPRAARRAGASPTRRRRRCPRSR